MVIRNYLWLIGLAACSDSNMTGSELPPAETLPIMTAISNRADLVSGGDVMIEVVLPPSAGFAQLTVTLGATDVTSAFAERAGGRITGLVTGLADGANELNASIGGAHHTTLTITNHKIGGPVLSGAQVTPFVCATPLPTAGSATTAATNASGMSTAAIDDQCNIASEAVLFYRSSSGDCRAVRPDPSPPAVPPADACFKPYNPSAPAPADLAMTTTTAGVTVPYIVRVEHGTLNRGIYEIAVLFDPKADDVKKGWSPFAPQPGWNGKVVYSFGASSGQPRRQFRSEQTWADDVALRGGFLVAINSMTDSLYNSNRVSMSETVMMMKEKITKSYGEITYTIGNGCSGGSINQLTTASIFPGLLDGIQPTCTYPDSETTAIEVADCTLLVDFYNTDAWKTLMTGKTPAEINAKKAAINGHVDQTGCHAWVNSFSNLGRPGNYIPIVVADDTGRTIPDPRVTTPINNCQLPNNLIYDKATKPDGIRCTGADHAANILGKREDGYAARDTRDNVGVQYGLKAYLDGAITADEFVTLNEKIGGADADDEHTTARSAASEDALATVYRAGIVSDGAHLSQLPIIDLRGNDDSNKAPPGAFGIHHIWRSYALRARLDDANDGHHDNHVMWRYGTSLVAPPQVTVQAFLMMDKWLGAMHADGGGALAERVVANKPEDAEDVCFLPSDATFSTKVTDAALCDAEPLLVPHASPRQVAGGPRAENILKCQLRELDRGDYPDTMTPELFTRLTAAFPDGVCDFTKPGVGQVPAEGVLSFAAGPGGKLLGDPPKVSVH